MQHHSHIHAATKALPAPLHIGAGMSQSDIADFIINRVAEEKGVSAPLMRNRSRCKRPVAEARQLAMYLTHVAVGMTMSSVGDVFGRDRTTIRHACACVEDRRDDAIFDGFVTVLENEIAAQMERRQ